MNLKNIMLSKRSHSPKTYIPFDPISVKSKKNAKLIYPDRSQKMVVSAGVGGRSGAGVD